MYTVFNCTINSHLRFYRVVDLLLWPTVIGIFLRLKTVDHGCETKIDFFFFSEPVF